MLSAFFITNDEKTILIEKQYREKIPRNEVISAIQFAQESTKMPSLLTNVGDMTILQIHRNNIWLIGVCEGDEFAALGVSIMKYIISLLETQLNGGANELSIKEQYDVVYRLLDYSIDFGFPLFNEGNTIKDIMGLKRSVKFSQGERLKLDLERPWRSSDVQRTNNQILLDVTETLDMVVAPNGKFMFSHVTGNVEALSMMSKTPLCKLILKPSVHLEDVAYHRCVEVSDMTARVIPFVPPEGRFTLMKYRLTLTQPKVPIFIVPKFTFSSGSLSFTITVKFSQDYQRPIENLILKFELPNGVRTPTFMYKNGIAVFDEANREATWKMQSIEPSVQQVELSGFASTDHDFVPSDCYPTVSMSFITTDAVPGVLLIEKLDVDAPYNSFRGLKYVLKSGTCEFRSSNCC